MKPRNREPVKARRQINKALFDNGMRHTHINRLLADPDFGALAERILELNPAAQSEAIACIPIAAKVQRLTVANSLLNGLREVAKQRRDYARQAKELGQAVPAGGDTGLVLLEGCGRGKVDQALVREATALLRYAGEEIGEMQAGASVTINNSFAAVDISQVIGVLAGNAPAPPREGS